MSDGKWISDGRFLCSAADGAVVPVLDEVAPIKLPPDRYGDREIRVSPDSKSILIRSGG